MKGSVIYMDQNNDINNSQGASTTPQPQAQPVAAGVSPVTPVSLGAVDQTASQGSAVEPIFKQPTSEPTPVAAAPSVAPVLPTANDAQQNTTLAQPSVVSTAPASPVVEQPTLAPQSVDSASVSTPVQVIQPNIMQSTSTGTDSASQESENKNNISSIILKLLIFVLLLVIGISLGYFLYIKFGEKTPEVPEVTDNSGVETQVEENTVTDNEENADLYVGNWYISEENMDQYVVVKEHTDDSVTVNAVYSSEVIFQDTVVSLSDNVGTFSMTNEDGSVSVDGTLTLGDNQILVEVTSSNSDLITTGSTYTFTYKGV